MINLMWKFMLFIGLVASIGALIISLARALHVKCIANNVNINIQTGIGTDANNMVHILGTLAMVCFFTALLSISKKTVIVSDFGFAFLKRFKIRKFITDWIENNEKY